MRKNTKILPILLITLSIATLSMNWVSAANLPMPVEVTLLYTIYASGSDLFGGLYPFFFTPYYIYIYSVIYGQDTTNWNEKNIQLPLRITMIHLGIGIIAFFTENMNLGIPGSGFYLFVALNVLTIFWLRQFLYKKQSFNDDVLDDLVE